MEVLKCRRCGGELKLPEGSRAAVCGHCGFRQAVPKIEQAEWEERFEQAGALLRECRFSEAAEAYAALTSDFPEEAEAVWGLMLAKRELEYADDPESGEKVPVFHDLEAESIVEDPEFDRVLLLAGDAWKEIYQSEAAALEEVFVGSSVADETEQLGKGIHALEEENWKAAETLFLRVLNGKKDCAEAYLGLMLAENRQTTLNEFLREIQNRFPATARTTETLPEDTERENAILETCVIPGYLSEEELRPLFSYPLTYESAVEAFSEAQHSVSQAIQEEKLLEKAQQFANGNFKKQLESTIQSFRDTMLENTAAAERERNAEKDKLVSCYAQHMNQAEQKASELSAAAAERREADYKALCKRQRQAHTPEELEAIAEGFVAMNGYKQSDNRVIVCKKLIEQGPKEHKLHIEKKKLIYLVTAAGVVVVLVSAILAVTPVCRYNAARRKYQSGEYEAALEAFVAQSGYKDSDDWADMCVEAIRDETYVEAMRLFDTGHYSGAKSRFAQLGSYRDSLDWVTRCEEALNQPPEDVNPGGNESPTPPPATAKPSPTPTAPPATATPSPTPTPTPTPSPTPEAYQLVNSVFSLTLPTEWKDSVEIRDDGTQIGFYEKSNMEAFGGHLFTLSLLTGEELMDSAEVPGSTFLGCLKSKDESVYLVMRRPTDVQFGSGEAEEAYREAEAAVDTAISSLKAVGGYSLTAPDRVRMESEQVILLDCSGNSAVLHLLCWSKNGWTSVVSTTAGIGSNGLTKRKQEGDHCTPEGTFSLKFCLAPEQPDTKLSFRKVEQGDIWACDIDSPYYNTLQKAGSDYQGSAEDIYKQLTSGRSTALIYFDFNGDGETPDTATPNGGAALFLDGIGPYGRLDSGYGDVKISGADMLDLLAALDSDKNPTITIRNAAD